MSDDGQDVERIAVWRCPKCRHISPEKGWECGPCGAAMDVNDELVPATALDEALKCLRLASEELGELTRPPWVEGLTPLVAEVRDAIRATLTRLGADDE